MEGKGDLSPFLTGGSVSDYLEEFDAQIFKVNEQLSKDVRYWTEKAN